MKLRNHNRHPMKPNPLPVQRKPVPRGLFRRLSAVTRSRKQRVAAGAVAAPDGDDDGTANIARALVIIFLFHIVAVGLIFFHQRFLNAGGGAATVETAVEQAPEPETVPDSAVQSYRVARQGDTYASVAEAENVDVKSLQATNGHVEMRPGLVLRIPAQAAEPAAQPAQEPAQAAAPATTIVTTAAVATPVGDEGLVTVAAPPRAVPVPEEGEEATVKLTGKIHVVKSGDSIWTIAKRHKVSRESLMKANGISDPSKLKAGARLNIPGS
jgi:LysM repeat protein